MCLGGSRMAIRQVQEVLEDASTDQRHHLYVSRH